MAKKGDGRDLHGRYMVPFLDLMIIIQSYSTVSSGFPDELCFLDLL